MTLGLYYILTPPFSEENYELHIKIQKILTTIDSLLYITAVVLAALALTSTIALPFPQIALWGMLFVGGTGLFIETSVAIALAAKGARG